MHLLRAGRMASIALVLSKILSLEFIIIAPEFIRLLVDLLKQCKNLLALGLILLSLLIIPLLILVDRLPFLHYLFVAVEFMYYFGIWPKPLHKLLNIHLVPIGKRVKR